MNSWCSHTKLTPSASGHCRPFRLEPCTLVAYIRCFSTVSRSSWTC